MSLMLPDDAATRTSRLDDDEDDGRYEALEKRVRVLERLVAAFSFPSVSKSKSVVVGPGIPCPSCKAISEKMRHADGWTPTPGRAWYSDWYVCRSPKCKKTMFVGGDNIFHAASIVKSEPHGDGIFDIDRPQHQVTEDDDDKPPFETGVGPKSPNPANELVVSVEKHIHLDLLSQSK